MVKLKSRTTGAKASKTKVKRVARAVTVKSKAKKAAKSSRARATPRPPKTRGPHTKPGE